MSTRTSPGASLGPVGARVLLGAAVVLTAGLGSAVLADEPAAAPARVVPAAAPARAVPIGPVVPARSLPPLAVAGTPVTGLHAVDLSAGDPDEQQSEPAAVPAVLLVGVIGPAAPPAQVAEVQRLLNGAGAALAVDGDWGPATTAAVRALQTAAGLAVDGRVGPQTLAVLRRED